jgi:SAM-dependent methyltransferase
VKENLQCSICNAPCSLLDVVDFNKSCEEDRGKFLTLSGIPVYYAICNHCGFCFAPEIAAWNIDEFAAKIYNDDYALIDPDCIENRPKAIAANLMAMFGERAQHFKHLDYGGGSGLLSNTLNKSNWQSTSYDPFFDKHIEIDQLGKFDLITATEVFEHVPSPRQLMTNLRSLLSPNGVIWFSTLLSDGYLHENERLSWWYASPRNGHISLFSRKSLAILAHINQFNLYSFSANSHAMFTNVPSWMAHLIHVG